MSAPGWTDVFRSMYRTDRDRDHFGHRWCGPDELPHGDWTKVASYPKDPEDGDGQAVDVYVSALPARFYALNVASGRDSCGGVLAGFRMTFGSGQGRTAHELAKLISQGMAGATSFDRHTHYQCECMNAGVKGRICDQCGTPFSWLPTDEEWREMGPLPDDDGSEPWAAEVDS